MVSLNQDFTVVRGDDVRQPFAVTLDEGRTLDGTESWRFVVRRYKTDSDALVSLTNPEASGIAIETVNTIVNCPVVVFTPSTLPISSFPATKRPRVYQYGLEMTKDGKVETIALGEMTVNTDVAR